MTHEQEEPLGLAEDRDAWYRCDRDQPQTLAQRPTGALAVTGADRLRRLRSDGEHERRRDQVDEAVTGGSEGHAGQRSGAEASDHQRVDERHTVLSDLRQHHGGRQQEQAPDLETERLGPGPRDHPRHDTGEAHAARGSIAACEWSL